MYVISARNVNHALPKGLAFLQENGVRRASRNGPVLVSPVPVTTVYERPTERVLFSAERDANPFFHLVEALWMLAGRNDLATLTPYVRRMADYSDDGGRTQPGAYGHRWRRHFKTEKRSPYGVTLYDRDQLSWTVRRLRADPNDRRVVVQMYDVDVDQDAADAGGRDVPCNVAVMPWVDAEGRLSVTVACRSNDAIWGAHGANAVHFAFLQEYLAAGCEVPVGRLYQVSNNYHAYVEELVKLSERIRRSEAAVMLFSRAGVPLWSTWEARDYYENDHMMSRPLLGPDDARGPEGLRLLDEDLTVFFDEPAAPGLRSSFLRRVACPMVLAHMAHRKGDREGAQEVLLQCRAPDWRQAGSEWLSRRSAGKEKVG